jgi:hypothetical protein
MSRAVIAPALSFRDGEYQPRRRMTSKAVIPVIEMFREKYGARDVNRYQSKVRRDG